MINGRKHVVRLNGNKWVQYTQVVSFVSSVMQHDFLSQKPNMFTNSESPCAIPFLDGAAEVQGERDRLQVVYGLRGGDGSVSICAVKVLIDLLVSWC